MAEMGSARMGSLLVKTDKTSNIFTGLVSVDVEAKENFRVALWSTDQQDGREYRINLGTTSQTALLHSASAYWLSTGKDDNRYQTGRYEWCWDYPWNVRTAGERYSKRIQFPKPFKQIPKVTTVITHIDSSLDKIVRAKVVATNIDTQGFNLNLESWSGKQL
jgi:hypothetical protein